jgi:hypothetical protein
MGQFSSAIGQWAMGLMGNRAIGHRDRQFSIADYPIKVDFRLPITQSKSIADCRLPMGIIDFDCRFADIDYRSPNWFAIADFAITDYR